MTTFVDDRRRGDDSSADHDHQTKQNGGGWSILVSDLLQPCGSFWKRWQRPSVSSLRVIVGTLILSSILFNALSLRHLWSLQQHDAYRRGGVDLSDVGFGSTTTLFLLSQNQQKQQDSLPRNDNMTNRKTNRNSEDQTCITAYKPVQNPLWDHVAMPRHLIDATTSLNTNTTDSNTTLLYLLEQHVPHHCGKLQRRDWLLGDSLSSSHDDKQYHYHLRDEIRQHQSNCSAPVMRFDVDNQFGLGSHLVLWSQALCNAWEQGYRIQTFVQEPNWLWLDQTHCHQRSGDHSSSSPLLCYFPRAEMQCAPTHVDPLTLPPVPDPRNRKLFCQRLRGTFSHNDKINSSSSNHSQQQTQEEVLRDFRAGSFAFLFQSLAPVVVHEAERQLGLLFPETHGIAPPNMITVHVRWGDKFWEMDLPSIDEYIKGVDQILENRRSRNREKHSISIHVPTETSQEEAVHIYLATEDPAAVYSFQQAIATANKTSWLVYVDRTVSELTLYRPKKGNRASWATRNTRGRAGLVALGSLLVALEARDFVLTTKSNWSRLLLSLYKELIQEKDVENGIRPAWIVDLRPGDW
ncbi:hypothetical protein ACA910_007950 [Epithemia clementina (nom. ined.)]